MIRSLVNHHIAMLVVCFAIPFAPIKLRAQPLPTVSSPQFGATMGTFSVDQSGAAEFGIEIVSPPGSAGLDPKLSLRYNSSGGNGLLGRGLTINGLSAIARCPATLSQDGFNDGVDFDGIDRFCLDGKRLMVTAGAYGAAGSEYRLEIDTFTRVIAVGRSGDAPTSFMAFTKDGTRYDYGATADSLGLARSAVGVTSTSALTWHLNRVTDRRGNYISYTYGESAYNTLRIPLRVDYTGNDRAAVAPYNSIRFEYENRADISTQYVAGAQLVVNQRMIAISTYTDSALVSRYTVSYDQDPNSGQSRALSIARCSGTGECLAPVTFTWDGTVTPPATFDPFSTVDSYAPAAGLTDSSLFPIFVGDWNGDGLADFGRMTPINIDLKASLPYGWQSYCGFYFMANGGVQPDSKVYPVIEGDWDGDGRTDFGRVNASGLDVFVSTGNDMKYIGTISDFSLAQGFTDTVVFPIFSGDWNGDGRTDIGRVSPNGVRFYASTGSGFSFYGDLQDLSPAQGYRDTDLHPLLLGDWNGDGRTDLTRAGPTALRTYFANGSSFSLQSDLNDLSPAQGYGSARTYPIFTGDWNGDGLADIARVAGQNTSFYLSDGIAFKLAWTITDYSPAQGFSDADTYPIVVGDWNGDGLADVARVNPDRVLMMRIVRINPYGITFYTSTGRGMVYQGGFDDFSTRHGYPSQTVSPMYVGDWDGDGVTDLGRVASGGPRTAVFKVHRPLGSSRVIAFKDGFGAVTKVDYRSLTNNTPFTDSAVYSLANRSTFPGVTIQPSTHVVRRTLRSDGIGGFRRTTYKYTDLAVSLDGRGSRGFRQIDALDEERAITTSSYYRQDFPYTGALELREVKQSGGAVLSRTRQTLTSVPTIGGASFVSVSGSVEESFDQNSTAIGRVSSTWVFDAYGSPTTLTVTQLDGATSTTTSTYSNDTTNWIIGLPLTTVVKKTTAAGAATWRTVYFAYEAGTALLAKQTVEPTNSALTLITQYAHDLFGNTIGTTTTGIDIPSTTEATTFSIRGQFPIRDTNALGHITQREFDPRFGTPVRIVTPDGLVSSVVYDTFGRETLRTNPDGTQNRTLLFQSPYTDIPTSKFITRTDETGRPPVIIEHDELQREVRRRVLGFDGTEILTVSLYDTLGQLIRKSDPFFVGASQAYSSFTYDLLGRSLSIVDSANRTTQYAYAGTTVTTTDSLNRSTVRTFSSSGKELQVKDPAGKTLSYTYDGSDNVLKTLDPSGSSISVLYDNRGNRVWMSDPDTGISTFAYDVLGRKKSETRRDGTQITYTYDKLNRMLTRTSTDGTERWTYDATPSGIGKLARVTNQDGTYAEDYTYDSLGRTSIAKYTVSGATYSFRYAYDSAGRLQSTTYPSGWAAYNDYNPYGILAQIRSATETVWKLEAMDARMAITRESAGNGIVTTRTFDAKTGALTRALVGTLADFNYKYDVAGRLTQRSDATILVSENFGYDTLDRLTSTQVAGQPAVTMTYSATGNITSRSDVGSYTYGLNAGVHAVTSITGAVPNTFTYDKRGNRITSKDTFIAFSQQNLPTSITKGLYQQRFQYAPSGARVSEVTKRSSSAAASFDIVVEKRVALLGKYEQTTQGTITKNIHYVKAGDTWVATITQEAGKADLATFVHADHLGSPALLTLKNGSVLERLSFDAWGNRRNSDWTRALSTPPTSTTNRGFTGHQQLDLFQLVHMNGRVYDPVVGRFLSPDPYVQSSGNLQALNRYSYVLNNPVSLVDPTGYFSFKKFFKTVITIAVAVTATYLTGGFATLPSLTTVLTSAAASSFAASSTAAALNGASFSEAIRGGLRSIPRGGLSALVAYGVGSIGEISSISSLERGVLHGTTQGAVNAAFGGKFSSAALGAFAGSYSSTISITGVRFFDAVAAGGLASAIGGGRFEDGAITAAFVHLYNDRLHQLSPYERKLRDATESMDYWTKFSFYSDRVGVGLDNASNTTDFLNLYGDDDLSDNFQGGMGRSITGRPKVWLSPRQIRFIKFTKFGDYLSFPSDLLKVSSQVSLATSRGSGAIADSYEQRVLEMLKHPE